jgi:hypothetical protein
METLSANADRLRIIPGPSDIDLRNVTIAAYDPDLDGDGRTLKAARLISSDIAHGAHG